MQGLSCISLPPQPSPGAGQGVAAAGKVLTGARYTEQASHRNAAAARLLLRGGVQYVLLAVVTACGWLPNERIRNTTAKHVGFQPDDGCSMPAGSDTVQKAVNILRRRSAGCRVIIGTSEDLRVKIIASAMVLVTSFRPFGALLYWGRFPAAAG